MADYNFPDDKLVDIPYLVGSCMDDEDTPFLDSDEIDLPPPPGSCEDELPAAFQYKNKSSVLPLNLSPPPPPPVPNEIEDMALIPMPATDIPEPQQDPEENSDSSNKITTGENEMLNVTETEKYIDDSKYSPYRMESDDENQDCISTKPKVLGKEQAKKRLMAFSLSKQPSPAVKKQNKLLNPGKSVKEKPPHPSKSSAVQDQFRATISAIEEEKKKIMQNMPDYLLLEMTDSSKPTHQIIKSSTQILEKPKQENTDSSSKDDKRRSNDSGKRIKDSSKRNSNSGEKRRNRSRSRRRSRSKSRRSHSRSRRSRSRNRKEDKNEKANLRDRNIKAKKELFEDWKSFTGFADLAFDDNDGNEEESSINKKNESRRRSTSPLGYADFKPIFNYLRKENRKMGSMHARPIDHSRSPVVFSEKVIKYTLAKPIISWAENPAFAKDFYMSRKMLLENCGKDTADIVYEIMKPKNSVSEDLMSDSKSKASREWYPRKNYLVPTSSKPIKDLQTGDFKSNETLKKVEKEDLPEKLTKDLDLNDKDNKNKEESTDGKIERKRTISLVNDSYLSDEEGKEMEEVVVGDVKVQLDVGTNCVKVRSKWDSDYEGEQSEKEGHSHKEKQKGVTSKKDTLESSKMRFLPVENVNKCEVPEVDDSKPETENLVSEYEEFLKMVSFDASDVQGTKSQEPLFELTEKLDQQKCNKPAKVEDGKPSKLETTDWDQESDREEKSDLREVSEPSIASQNKYVVPKTEKALEKKKKKVKVSKKKLEKTKLKKSKLLKKGKKKKKRKKKYSSSSDSSSDSDVSESDYDSDDSKLSKKKKNEKSRKSKKKKKRSSSESDSESDQSSKKKVKKKKKTKKKSGSGSSDSEKEVQSALLKQLDFKKQLIMKKIEEIDSINERSGKKKDKEHPKGKESLEESELLKSYIKSAKKKKGEKKVEQNKKKSKSEKKLIQKKTKELKKSESSSESDSDSSEEDYKKKKTKKRKKKKRDSSESSDSAAKSKKIDKSAKEKSLTKSKKFKKEKKKKPSSSESESEDSSPKTKKAKKKKKLKKEELKILTEENSRSSWKENLPKEEPVQRIEEKDFEWRDRKSWKKTDKTKKRKEGVNWETSSSLEDTPSEAKTRESSWDEVAPPSSVKKATPITEIEKNENSTLKLNEQEMASEVKANQPVPDTLKTSLSNFSFNENSFCGFGQELSRDFFLTEKGLSNSGENTVQSAVESRPFQSVSKSSEVSKPSVSERYSPGYSDSDASDEQPVVKVNSNSSGVEKDEVYDPLNCESETSVDNGCELSDIPLPGDAKTALKEKRNFKDIGVESPAKSKTQSEIFPSVQDSLPLVPTPVPKPVIARNDFVSFNETPTKRKVISVKGQQKLQSKAASVFQDESESEEETNEKTSETVPEVCKPEEEKRRKSRDRSRERDRRRSSSRERRNNSRRDSSPSRRRRSRTPDYRRKEKKEIKSDSFEIEPLKGSIDTDVLEGVSVQPIPVLTSSERLWSKSHLPDYSSSELLKTTGNLIDNAESFDIYPPEDPSLRNQSYVKDYDDERSKKEKRKSRSRSLSPRKKRRSKSPERRRSPRRRSPSPKRRERSPYSPRRRSPRRKSPSRRYKSSRSPEKRRKSRSRSPRKRRSSPYRRSRSSSPRKHRSPKRRCGSPRRDSLPRMFISRDLSPRNDSYSSFQNRIPVLGAPCESTDIKTTPPRFEEFPTDPALTGSDMNNSFYSREYHDEFVVASYPEDVSGNNLITVKSHEIEKSPQRLSLDQRIELELGVPLSTGPPTQNDQFQMQDQQFPDNQYQNSYNCENNANGNEFGMEYQNQSVPITPEFNGSYFTHPPPNFPTFSPSYPPPQPVQNSVMQVGNIVEVVPTIQQPPPTTPAKPQIMQVGNVLQVVPSPKVVQTTPPPQLPPHDFSAPPPPVPPPLVKTQKATAVVAPSSIVPTPNPEAVINPLIKAIQLEREKRRKEKEKRKAEREARRKARQLRREAKLLSVNEKLKKSVQDEGVMLGQEVDDDELMDGSDLPSPPIPVEIITVSSQSTLPPGKKGILITAGFMPKPPSEKKEVKFADGVCPGEGTSTSADEDIVSPPPKPKLPKEKRFKKKKTKVKKKVKVQIIRQIIQAEDDDDDDDLSPPPPPPGDPPPVFFARFPFVGDAQFPVYQTQTTTTTLTTVQYPAQSFQ